MNQNEENYYNRDRSTSELGIKVSVIGFAIILLFIVVSKLLNLN